MEQVVGRHPTAITPAGRGPHFASRYIIQPHGSADSYQRVPGSSPGAPWSSPSMALRWTAAAMHEAKKGFRRLKAFRQHLLSGGTLLKLTPQFRVLGGTAAWNL
jgi:hypothetical protein